VEASLATLAAVPTDSREPRVSVILPVYNSRDYLRECLDSVITQDLESGFLELVAIDDGSTDGSGEILDEYARRHSFIRVMHQENSGWPGQPRNRGIEAARGEYVFFLDSDDALGPEAMRRLYEFAEEHGSEVVVARIVYTSAPSKGRKTWGRQTVDADLRRVFKSLSPQKLFRRSFLEEHRLRFPEGEVRLEDGIFVTRAYLLAERVSLLGDYPYYRKRRRDDRTNISLRRMSAAGYVGSLRRIAGNVRELCAEQDLAADLLLSIYSRKGLTRLVKGRRSSWLRRRKLVEWVTELAGFAEEFVPQELDQRLPAGRRRLSAAVRARDVGTVAARARAIGSRPPRGARKRPSRSAPGSRQAVEGMRRYARAFRRKLARG
jgi:poly(ribitol-phosphate) beta-N-acetylglucosaminyltransferase